MEARENEHRQIASSYLTTEQAADALQVSGRTVLQWLRSGVLPGRKLGGLWRIHPDVLDQFIRGDSPAAVARGGDGHDED